MNDNSFGNNVVEIMEIWVMIRYENSGSIHNHIYSCCYLLPFIQLYTSCRCMMQKKTTTNFCDDEILNSIYIIEDCYYTYITVVSTNLINKNNDYLLNTLLISWRKKSCASAKPEKYTNHANEISVT